jgi:hypothetical protein
MRKKLSVIIVYISLLVLSMPVPLLHLIQTDRAIESMRPAVKLADGSWVPTLMPFPILLLRWLGQLSWFIPFIVLTMFVLSFRREVFARFTTICALAICQCAFDTFYALYSTWLLGLFWLHRLT